MTSRDALFTPWLKNFKRARAHGTLQARGGGGGGGCCTYWLFYLCLFQAKIKSNQIPVSSSQGSEFEFPWLGLRCVTEDSLKLCLELAGQEVAPPSVQPHLEETALVVHN